MKIKRFIAASLPEAMKQAKEQMGNEAIIIYSRKYKEGGFFGLFAREKFEITVAVDEPYHNDLTPAAVAEIAADMNSSLKAGGEFPTGRPGSSHDSSITELMKEIQSMKNMVEDLKDRIEDEPPKSGSRNDRMLLKLLTARKVDPKLANRIVKMVGDRMEKEKAREFSRAKELCVQVISELVKMPRGIDLKDGTPRLVVLIGPTGVGKTTTIAKLAAKFSLIDQKKVGLITMDTYRIAAVEQLRVYADIIGLPLEVVVKAGDLKAAINSLSACNLIFIDTAGRNPRNEPQMEELVSLLDEANPDEVILVLSATTSTEDLLDTYKLFNTIRIDKIIFTKLDETTSYGPILNVISRTKKRISYVTNGQNVPDDIELPDDLKLAQLILGDD